MLNEMVQIIDLATGFYSSPVQSVRIEILTGRYYKGEKYRYRLDTFKQCFKPYTAENITNGLGSSTYN